VAERNRGLLASAALALTVCLMAAVMYATHRTGHWWGDDWALYIRQAKGLLDGHPNRVAVENRFTVVNSLGPEFSPPLYPWGYPLLLAPFIAVLGVDLDALMVVGVLSAVVYACCWYHLARRRLGTVPALLGVLAVTLTPLLLSWAELIQSEWPFLAVSAVALVAIDAVAERGGFTQRTVRWPALIGVGLLATAAFTVRREGLAVIGAIVAAQFAGLIDDRLVPWRLDRPALGRLSLRLAVPLVSFLVSFQVLQALLPSTVIPKYRGTSLTNLWRLRGRLVRNLGHVSGIQRPWDKDPVVLGSVWLGWTLLAAFLIAGVAGILVSIVRSRRRDLHIAAYAAGAYVIGGSFRSPINRYVSTVAPMLMLLALVALATLVDGVTRRSGRRWVTPAVVCVPLLAIIAGNAANAHLRIDAAARFQRLGMIEWGPTHPDAIAMFDEVEALTGPDDVVAAPKARAMVLETGRASIQVDDYRPLPTDLDLALIITERAGKVEAELAGKPDLYRLVWSNPRFSLYEPGG
jgi:Dolichyl-phosphate-mannose-protein mannosyltransferase